MDFSKVCPNRKRKDFGKRQAEDRLLLSPMPILDVFAKFLLLLHPFFLDVLLIKTSTTNRNNECIRIYWYTINNLTLATS